MPKRAKSDAARRLSEADVASMQAIHDQVVSLGAACAMREQTEPTMHTTETRLTELAMSHGDLARLLRDALRALHPGQNTWVWTRDVYDDRVVYELTVNDVSTLYQRSYAVVDGTVTFGDAVPVIVVTTYVPIAEAAGDDLTSDLTPLLEQAVGQDGAVALRIIAPGQGSSGYYAPEVLKRDGPKVFTTGLHMHLDHPSLSEEADRPERSVTTLAGALISDARWEDAGAAGPGLYAEARVRSDLAPLINELAPHIGVSIRARGKASQGEVDGKRTRVIDSIERAQSIDFVTVPGAGGRVLDLIEAARSRRETPPGEDDEVSKEELEELKQKLDEATAREAARDQELARLREVTIHREAQTVVAEALAAATLPAMAKARLAPQLAANPPLTEAGELDRDALTTRVQEAAAAEADYLAKLGGNGRVRDMGGEPSGSGGELPTLDESEQRIAAALANL